MMAAAGVPVVPGYHGGDQSEDRSAQPNAAPIDQQQQSAATSPTLQRHRQKRDPCRALWHLYSEQMRVCEGCAGW